MNSCCSSYTPAATAMCALRSAGKAASAAPTVVKGLAWLPSESPPA
jgi:hypothetical protein